ncbi:RING finger protein 141 [Nymphon striatum]|nr:RING finger protein 141 [Nymphon striatum]
MGIQSSKQLKKLQEDLQNQTTPMKEIALITFDEFSDKIKELNTISKIVIDDHDKQLIFSIKKGSDSSIFWKKTVKIACIKVDRQTNSIDSARLLSLAQEQIVELATLSFDANKTIPKAVEAGEDVEDVPTCTRRQDLTASVIFNAYVTLFQLSLFGQEDESALNECCICMERRPEVILPCAHNYCLPCIEQWNVCHKSCPICRETLKNTDETWVIYDVPDSAEVASELGKTLMKLTDT